MQHSRCCCTCLRPFGNETEQPAMLYTVHLSIFGIGNKLFKIGSSAARLLNVIVRVCVCVLAIWLSRICVCLAYRRWVWSLCCWQPVKGGWRKTWPRGGFEVGPGAEVCLSEQLSGSDRSNKWLMGDQLTRKRSSRRIVGGRWDYSFILSL